MLDKTYTVSAYFAFKVLDPKPRIIYALDYKDRVVQHVLCDNFLEPHFTKKVIYDNAGCVKGRGQHFAIKRVRKFLQTHYTQHGTKGYFLKCDIKKFYPSLSHSVIKAKFNREIQCPDIKVLFNKIVDSFETPTEFLKANGIPTFEKKFIAGKGFRTIPIKRGVPIGNQSSQIIGVYYLNSIDRYIKEELRIKHYIRYMDDFILLHYDKEFLQKVLITIKEKLKKELKLETNNKTQIVSLANGITFLGHRITLNKNGEVVNRIVPKTVKKFRKRVKNFNKHPEQTDPENKRSTMASYTGHLKHSYSRSKAREIASGLNVRTKKRTNQETKYLLELAEEDEL